MQKITSAHSHSLYDVAATRRIERVVAGTLPPHTLMQRAGTAVARLTMALAPHAQSIWIACGPGNNGGDGFEAAAQLHFWGKNVTVTRIEPGPKGLPPDAAAALQKAIAAGVSFAEQPPERFDFCIDALLGIGGADALSTARPGSALMLAWLDAMRSRATPCLAVDVPSGLDGDTGTMNRALVAITSGAAHARICWPAGIFTLSLLTLKPGLFTAQGRDAAGEVWFEDLATHHTAAVTEPPSARLLGSDGVAPTARSKALHDSHKGTFGDVAVVGGQSMATSHMVGAALLAARAALRAGAGRVFVALLEDKLVQEHRMTVDSCQPELMFRALDALHLERCTVVCGCGGGQAVKAVLPKILLAAPHLVLDADALNAIAADPDLMHLLKARSSNGDLNKSTVLTPHPLEAARLLGITAAQVQSDRLEAARQLAAISGAVVVLKGSGTVIAAPATTSCINYSGNALLATAGTGDVLAGMVGAKLASGLPAFDAACSAVFLHGQLADDWQQTHPSQALTASGLSASI
jgi:ADP-dependent NAD(P)H-hydrate dehydratase / NAD(P)H-hydrate epimerase